MSWNIHSTHKLNAHIIYIQTLHWNIHSTYKLNTCIIYTDDMLKHTFYTQTQCMHYIHTDAIHIHVWEDKGSVTKILFFEWICTFWLWTVLLFQIRIPRRVINVQKWNCCSASGQVQEYKEVVEFKNNIFFLDTSFHQCGLLFWVVLKDFGGQLQKRSSKNILWNGPLTGINKWLVKGTTLKTS